MAKRKHRPNPEGLEAVRAVKRALGKQTQEELAQRLDVSLASISRWARARCLPRGGQARRIVEALGR